MTLPSHDRKGVVAGFFQRQPGIALAFLLLTTPLAAQDQLFEESVKPILTANCTPCHAAQTRTSSFSIASAADVIAGGGRRGPAVLAGKPDDSVLIRVLRGQLQPRMPLGTPPLPADQIDTIARWITELKPEPVKAQPTTPKWWAFDPPRKPEPPEVRNTAWVRNEIDRLVLAKLESGGLEPSPEASRLILLRRAYFDLIGLPPSPEDAFAFINDASPDAWERLIDRLLAHPGFGERWGRHWLDLARYADTQGFEADRENYHMWRYRDYVIDAFNKDKPYDLFVKEQLAGDEIAPLSPDARIATGFLRLGPRFQGTNAQELRQMTLDEITGTAASVFLAITMKCAQCHDHKYDPVPQRDFYRLQAFFVPIELADAPAPFTDPSFKSKMEQAQADCRQRLQAAQRRFDEYQKQLLEKLAAAGEKPQDARTAAAGLNVADGEIGNSFLRRITPEVALLERRLTRAIANGVVPNTEDKLFTLEEQKKYIELLTHVDGNRGGRDMGILQRELRRYQPSTHAVRNAPSDANRPAIPVAFVRIGGEFSRPGEWVLPGFPTALGGSPDPAPLPADNFGNVRAWRTPLANWIASPANPLTARVMANRVWQHLFGVPLVATPSDFGRNGARPSNQELLDWLAVRFTEHKWSVKSLIRHVMLSAAYRQTSLRTATKERQADPDNLWIWRQNRKRLEGDVLRDSLLAVSGRLNPESGGPGAMPRLPEAIKDRMTIKNFPAWIPSDGPETRKRSVYVFQRRQLEVPFLSVMDAPVFQSSCDRRAVSTTALQALALLNDDLVTEQAAHFAARVREEAASGLNSQVERAFLIAFSRKPEPDELRHARALAGSGPGGLVGLCRVLMNANEFVYVD